MYNTWTSVFLINTHCVVARRIFCSLGITHILLPMYRNQSSLPRLPVPSLRQTIDKYLYYVKGMITREAFQNTEKIANQFAISAEGQKLHSYVEQMAHNPRIANWLERWWSDAYLKDRFSCGVYVSPILTMTMHSNTAVNSDSCVRAALLIKHSVELKYMIEQQKLEPKLHKGEPICMEDFQYLFNCNRAPHAGRDTQHSYPESTHIVVIRRGHIFKLEVMDRLTGKPRPVAEIVRALKSIKERATEPAELSLGAVTALSRDEWARVRGSWMESSPKNVKLLLDIESAICVVTLDESNAKVDTTEAMWSMFFGFGDPTFTQATYVNRFWDKSLQVHVADSGLSGITFEHSGQDSLPPVSWMEYCTNRGAEDAAAVTEALQAATQAVTAADTANATELVLDASLGPELRSALIRGVDTMNSLMSQLDLSAVLVGFGAKRIKAMKLSPDSFCQLAFQVVFKELFGYTPSTYESATTKRYLRGRTETIRTVTPQSVAFVESYLSRQPEADIAQAMLLAGKAHAETTAACTLGHGCDRHLYGMLSAARELGLPLPEIFTDPSYAFFSKIELSTTFPLPTPGARVVGFGPVSANCVGIGYYIHPDEIVLGLSTWQMGLAEQFGDRLRYTMSDLALLMEKYGPAGQSKL